MPTTEFDALGLATLTGPATNNPVASFNYGKDAYQITGNTPAYLDASTYDYALSSIYYLPTESVSYSIIDQIDLASTVNFTISTYTVGPEPTKPQYQGEQIGVGVTGLPPDSAPIIYRWISLVSDSDGAYPGSYHLDDGIGGYGDGSPFYPFGASFVAPSFNDNPGRWRYRYAEYFKWASSAGVSSSEFDWNAMTYLVELNMATNSVVIHDGFSWRFKVTKE
jgi:hypothetical protein